MSPTAVWSGLVVTLAAASAVSPNAPRGTPASGTSGCGSKRMRRSVASRTTLSRISTDGGAWCNRRADDSAPWLRAVAGCDPACRECSSGDRMTDAPAPSDSADADALDPSCDKRRMPAEARAQELTVGSSAAGGTPAPCTCSVLVRRDAGKAVRASTNSSPPCKAEPTCMAAGGGVASAAAAATSGDGACVCRNCVCTEASQVGSPPRALAGEVVALVRRGDGTGAAPAGVACEGGCDRVRCGRRAVQHGVIAAARAWARLQRHSLARSVPSRP